MLFSTAIYGSSAVKSATERVSAPVLVIGRDQFTRAELAAVSCFSFVAARNLTELLSTAKAESVRQVYQEISPFDLAIPNLGPISLMVLGAAFEIRGVGTIESWAAKHKAKDAPAGFVTFNTLKHQHDAIEKHAATSHRRKRRK